MSRAQRSLEMLDAAEIAATFPDSFLVLTLNLTVEYANERFYDFFQVGPAESIGRPLAELGNGQWNIPSLLEPLGRIIAPGTTIENYEVEHVFESIGHRIMRLNARKTIRPGNGSQRILLVLEDVTTEVLAARDVERQERLMTGIVDTLREPLLVLDADHVVLAASKAFYRVFQTSPDATLGLALPALGNGQWAIPGLLDLLGDVLARDAPIIDYEVRHDFPGIGEKLIVLNASKIIRDGEDSGTILLAMQDMTRERRVELEREAALARANDLLEELNHRVMNSLSIVSAIVSFEGHSLSDAECRAAFERMRARIGSIGSLYKLLVHTDRVNEVPAGEYLGGVVQEAVAAFGPVGWELDFEREVAPIMLSTRIALPLGLALNELTINSLKYAFTDRKAGRLDLRVENSGSELNVQFRDDGHGIDKAARVDSGRGEKLTNAMIAQLGGTITRDSGDGGTAYTISIPLVADEG